jgi:hypothetical protein
MEYNCPCGKSYNYPQGLYKHRKTCTEYQKTLEPTTLAVAEVVKPSIEPNDTVEHYKQLLEEQEKRYKLLLQEKDKRIEEKDKRIEEMNRLLEEKDRRIEEHKQTIEFMKSLTHSQPQLMQPQIQPMQPREPNGSQAVESKILPRETLVSRAVEPSVLPQEPARESKIPPEPTPVEKPFNLKEYLDSRNPITVEEFFNEYKPTIEEFESILSNGIVNATILNFAAYAKSYGDQCPFVVTNVQYERLRIYAYEENKWVEYDRIYAQMHLDKIINRFVNKYFTYISVFNSKYTDCMVEKPSLLMEDNVDIYKKQSLMVSLCRAYEYTDKICKELSHEFSINRGNQ